MALVGSLEEDTFVPHTGLKRLVKGGSRKPTPEADTHGGNQPARARAPSEPRPKTGIKLKLKINGAVLAKKSGKPSHSPTDPARQRLQEETPSARLAALDALGLPEDAWVPPAPSTWRNLGQKPRRSKSQEPTPVQPLGVWPTRAPSPENGPVVSLPQHVRADPSPARPQIVVADFTMGGGTPIPPGSSQGDATGASTIREVGTEARGAASAVAAAEKPAEVREGKFVVGAAPAGPSQGDATATVPEAGTEAKGGASVVETAEKPAEVREAKHGAGAEPAAGVAEGVGRRSGQQEGVPGTSGKAQLETKVETERHEQGVRKEEPREPVAAVKIEQKPREQSPGAAGGGNPTVPHQSSETVWEEEKAAQPALAAPSDQPATAAESGEAVGLPGADGLKSREARPGAVGEAILGDGEAGAGLGESNQAPAGPVKQQGGDGGASPAKSSSSDSSSSSSSSSSDSDSGTPGVKRKRGSRSRSREAGEASDDEERAAKRRALHNSGFTGKPERSPSIRHRSRERDRDREYERERTRRMHRDSERKYARTRYDEERYSHERGDHERSRRHERDYRDARDRDRVRDRDGQRVPDSRDRGRSRSDAHALEKGATRPYEKERESRDPKAQDSSKNVRPNGTRIQPYRPSMLGDPQRAARRTESPSYLPPLPKEEPPAEARVNLGAMAQPPLPEEPQKPIGFADAWNMLYGSAKEGWGSESQITELHNAATEAKRNYENLAKATNGKHTFENLVALMRDSYLKFMKVGAIWESELRMPNANPTRTRARLADDGGMFPQTVSLLRQVASDCRTCPANTEASKILRILAEKLAAIIQMRIVQIQRNKVGQDHQILLACKGAPRVDAHGRRMPPAETAGETFQRPSPTDSNASNNTSEQAVNPLPRLSPAASAAPAPQKPPQAARAGPGSRTPTPPSGTAAAKLGVKGGKVAKKHGTAPPKAAVPTTAAKGKRPAMPVPTGPGRDDAWAVLPLPWEIPTKHFDSLLRSWSVLGGFMTLTGNTRGHLAEIEAMMQCTSESVREAAGMLGFLDLNLGLTSMGVVLHLSHSILHLVLKIQAATPGALPPPGLALPPPPLQQGA